MKYKCALFPIYPADKMKEDAGHEKGESMNETMPVVIKYLKCQRLSGGLYKAKLTEGAMINRTKDSD